MRIAPVFSSKDQFLDVFGFEGVELFIVASPLEEEASSGGLAEHAGATRDDPNDPPVGRFAGRGVRDRDFRLVPVVVGELEEDVLGMFAK